MLSNGIDTATTWISLLYVLCYIITIIYIHIKWKSESWLERTSFIEQTRTPLIGYRNTLTKPEQNSKIKKWVPAIGFDPNKDARIIEHFIPFFRHAFWQFSWSAAWCSCWQRGALQRSTGGQQIPNLAVSQGASKGGEKKAKKPKLKPKAKN